MMTGTVTGFRQGLLRLKVHGPLGQSQEIEAIIDTGFNSSLSLSPALIARLGLAWRRRAFALLADGSQSIVDIYEGTVIWDGVAQRIAVDEADFDPLIGMTLMDGFELNMVIRAGGQVTLRALP